MKIEIEETGITNKNLFILFFISSFVSLFIFCAILLSVVSFQLSDQLEFQHLIFIPVFISLFPIVYGFLFSSIVIVVKAITKKIVPFDYLVQLKFIGNNISYKSLFIFTFYYSCVLHYIADIYAAIDIYFSNTSVNLWWFFISGIVVPFINAFIYSIFICCAVAILVKTKLLVFTYAKKP